MELCDVRVGRYRKGEVDVLARRSAVGDEREGAVVSPDVEPRPSVLGHAERECLGDGLPKAAARLEIADSDPEVIDHWAAAGLAKPTARFDAVAVGVEEKGAVVVRVVLRPQPRLAVARVARIGARLPEGIDLLARTRGEANMEMARHRMVVVSLRHRVVAPLVKGRARLHRLEAEHGEDDVVEPATRLLVGGADRDVVEHQRTSIASPKE